MSIFAFMCLCPMCLLTVVEAGSGLLLLISLGRHDSAKPFWL